MIKQCNTYRRFGSAVILAAGALCFASSPAIAAPRLGVSVTSDSTVMEMGDRTNIHIRLSAPAAMADSARIVNLPQIDTEVSGVYFISAKADTTKSESGDMVFTDYNFLVQAFDPGMITFDPIAAVIGSAADTTFSDVLTLKVLPVDVDSLETINPIAGVVAPHSRWYDIFPDWTVWVLLAIAVLAFAGAVIYFITHRKQIIIERHKVVIPPYELAMSRLNDLRARKLAESGHDKEYYTELVDILRQYLDGRFGINAMEMTTTQIVKALRGNQETRMTAEQMKPVLDIADFVKFAKVRPMPEDNARSFATAVDFIEQTKPAPEPEKEEVAESLKTGRSPIKKQ